MNNSLFFFISATSLDMSITAKMLLGRWFCLSNKGNNEISYTQYAAISEGFSERSYKRAKKFLLDNGFIKSRVTRSLQPKSIIEVQKMTENDYIVIQLPKKVLEHLKTPAERFIFGRLYALSNEMSKEVQYSYEELSEDLGLSVSCCKKTISKLSELGFVDYEKTYNPFTRTYENMYKVLLPNFVNEDSMVCKNGTEQSAKNTQAKCQNYTSNVPKVHSPHYLKNNNECLLMNKEQHDLTLPESFKDVKPLFDDYFKKYSEVKPELNALDTTDLSIAFFEYFDSRHWVDSKGKAVDPSTLRQRVATWMKHVNIPVVSRKTTPSGNRPRFEYNKERSIFRHLQDEENYNNALEVQTE